MSDRRSFLKLGSAAAVALTLPGRASAQPGALPGSPAALAAEKAPLAPGVSDLYRKSVIIDALGSPGIAGVRYPYVDHPLAPEQLANARASGITAMNVTLQKATADGTFKSIADWKAEIAAHPDYLLHALTAADIERAKRKGKMAIIMGFQGLDMLGNDISLIDRFHAEGVRIMQLSYNKQNTVAAGSLDPDTKGLTPFGREVVARMNALGVTVDTAHGNTRLAIDTAAASKKPIAITHTGCRAIYNHPRNLPDVALKAVADKGGVVGIFLMPFLGLDPTDATRAMLIKHLDHALKICGEDHVGIGTDGSSTPIKYDAAYVKALGDMAMEREKNSIAAPLERDRMMGVPQLNFPRRLELVASDLLKAGHSTKVVEKVVGGNFLRLFGQTW